MKKIRKKTMDVGFEQKTLPVSLITCDSTESDWEKKALKNRSAYILLNGSPEFAVNETGDGKFCLLTQEFDFHAVKMAGIREVPARVYKFSAKNAEAFSLTERLKGDSLSAMDEAYLMQKLIKEHRFTQNDVAAYIGKSRPSVANTLRLLTHDPEVIGMIESGKLSAGHARTLVKVPKDKQLAFANEALRRKFSVREMERAVKAFLTPPEVLKQEKEAKAAAKSEALKTMIERMRALLGMQVSLIGSDKKGRIYIDYHSAEDLERLEEALGISTKAEQISLFTE